MAKQRRLSEALSGRQGLPERSVYTETAGRTALLYRRQGISGELLLRIMDSWPDTYDEIDVPPGDVMKFDEFRESVKRGISDGQDFICRFAPVRRCELLGRGGAERI